MLYAVLVASFPCPEVFIKGDSARVIAHNLQREDAEAMKQSLHSQSETMAGEDFKFIAEIAEYDSAHAAPEADDCEDCMEMLLAYHSQMLALCEKQAANRGGRILKENLDKPQ